MCAPAGLRYSGHAIFASAAIACLHSLVAVQALVLCAFITPNQDLAFVLAVSYDVLSSLLAGVWVHIHNLVRPPWTDPEGLLGLLCKLACHSKFLA